MAVVIERTTKGGERRVFVVFHALDRTTAKRRKIWESQATSMIENGRVRVLGKKDAERRRREVERLLDASGGVWPAVAPEPETITLRIRGNAWLARHRVNLRDRVYDNYKASLENHIYPLLGTQPIDELGPADAKLLRDTMRGAGLADDTIRAALVPLRGIVYDWAEDAKVPNPLAGLRLFAQKDAGRARRKIVPPEAAAISEVVEHARPQARDAILVAAATGLRRGELFAVRWRDVDFASNELHVTAYNFGGVVEDGRFKTEAGERDVPLFRSIRKVLLERKAREKYSGPDDFVFASTVGTPVDPNNFVKRELHAAVKRANAKRAEKAEGSGAKFEPLPTFRWHDFRHFAVSTLIAQKADILTLARIAGHSDPNVTLKVYGHLMQGALSEAAELYDPLRDASGG